MVVLEPGDQVMASLASVAEQHGLAAATFTALGAVSRATLAFFDRATRTYDEFTVDEQVEVLTLVGNISVFDGAPRVHAHMTLGFPDGSVRGGHLVEADVWPTLEISVTSWPSRIERQVDPVSTLPLIAITQDRG